MGSCLCRNYDLVVTKSIRTIKHTDGKIEKITSVEHKKNTQSLTVAEVDVESLC